MAIFRALQPIRNEADRTNMARASTVMSSFTLEVSWSLAPSLLGMLAPHGSNSLVVVLVPSSVVSWSYVFPSIVSRINV